MIHFCSVFTHDWPSFFITRCVATGCVAFLSSTCRVPSGFSAKAFADILTLGAGFASASGFAGGLDIPAADSLREARELLVELRDNVLSELGIAAADALRDSGGLTWGVELFEIVLPKAPLGVFSF